MTKEEKRDEIKNKISMALKDPLLQQCFEIICKNLTVLEDQIADIKANCDLAIEGRDVKIKELEQENAGLKAGRPQWHDLRKNPNDLPKEYDIIRKAFGIYEEEKAKHIVQNECGERVFCFNGTWYHEKGGEAHPIAWCEIPTFDKE